MPKVRLIKYSKIIAVILLLIFLYNLRLIVPAESFLIKLINPILGSIYNTGNKINLLFSRQFDQRDLQNENDDLKNENKLLTVNNSKMNLLEAENKTLREYLKFIKQNNYKFILANVVSISDLSNEDQSIAIDKGSAEGLMPGLLVVNEEGIAVGKVTQVKEHLSFVQLTTSSKCKLAATIQNTAKTSGITQGELGLTINLDFIPLPEVIKNGDIVITSGLESNIPRGVVIGRITKIEKANNELWQKAVIESMIKPNEMIIVSVIIP